MPDTPPSPPPSPPKEPFNSNPNPDSASEINPSEKSQPSTPENQNPVPELHFDESQKNPGQEAHAIEQIQQLEEDDLEKEQEQDQEEEDDDEEEGINMPISPPSQSLNSKVNYSRRGVRKKKRGKKGFGKKSEVAVQRKMQGLSGIFKPIPFVPNKSLDFSKHEEGLKKLGLWDFAHLEFDRNIRVELLVQLIVKYVAKNRVSYVNDVRVKVSRADLARALKLPVKKTSGDSEGESFSAEFLGFLDDFTSSWMLLNDDVWVTPCEIVNWLKLIKEGQPHKLDWAGLIWFMMEKELAQGSELKECYYASHFQQLIKDQKEDLLKESSKVVVENQEVVKVALDDDEDTKMLDPEELILGEGKSEEQSTGVNLDQECVTQFGKDGDSGMVGMDCDSEKAQKDVDADMAVKDGGADNAVKDADADNAVKDADNVVKDADADNAVKDADADTVVKDDDADTVVKDDDADSVKMKAEDTYRMENEDIEGNRHLEEADNVGVVWRDECAEVAENSEEKSRDVDMIDFGVHGQLLTDVRNDGCQPFLQPCSMAGDKMSTENAGLHVGGKDVEVEEHEAAVQVQGFDIQPRSTGDGTTSVDLMHALETGQLAFASTDFGGSSSLGLTTTRVVNDVVFGGSSLFNHSGKREIGFEHDISHHSLNENHKRMRMDGHWDDKPPSQDMCVDQILHWAEKLKMSRDAAKDDAYQQASMINFYSQQVEDKEAEILQLRCKVDELQRKRQAEVSRRDRELYLMRSVIDGYRRALQETQRKFAEYRKRCRVSDEPIYKDVGSGGVVKSIMELEREGLKKEEEQRKMRYLLEVTFHKHLADFESQWQHEVVGKVETHEMRLEDAAEEFELLRNKFVKHDTSENVMMSEGNQNENGQIADVQADDAQIADVQTDDAQIADVQTDDAQIADVQTDDAQIADGQTDETQVADVPTDDALYADAQTDNVQMDDDHNLDAQNNDAQTEGVQSEDVQNDTQGPSE